MHLACVMDCYSFGSFQPFKGTERILSSQALQEQAAGHRGQRLSLADATEAGKQGSTERGGTRGGTEHGAVSHSGPSAWGLRRDPDGPP